MRAIEVGNPFQIKAAQKFYLRSSETLRRLDLAVETERRNAEEQVPMRQIEDIALQIATWFRLAFDQFLSSESRSLMGDRRSRRIFVPLSFSHWRSDRGECSKKGLWSRAVSSEIFHVSSAIN
jgi:hypothetical protein